MDMKTFFNITIEGLGDTQTFRVQSTKLRKFDKSAKYGFYRLKKKIQVGNYYIDVVLALTRDVELGGIVGKLIRQSRYTIHQVHHEVYTLSSEDMYINQSPTLCSVSVELEEQGVELCNCTIEVDVR